jgi:hypothetical protein
VPPHSRPNVPAFSANSVRQSSTIADHIAFIHALPGYSTLALSKLLQTSMITAASSDQPSTVLCHAPEPPPLLRGHLDQNGRASIRSTSNRPNRLQPDRQKLTCSSTDRNRLYAPIIYRLAAIQWSVYIDPTGRFRTVITVTSTCGPLRLRQLLDTLSSASVRRFSAALTGE